MWPPITCRPQHPVDTPENLMKFDTECLAPLFKKKEESCSSGTVGSNESGASAVVLFQEFQAMRGDFLSGLIKPADFISFLSRTLTNGLSESDALGYPCAAMIHVLHSLVICIFIHIYICL
jgi:hypothetical protein